MVVISSFRTILF